VKPKENPRRRCCPDGVQGLLYPPPVSELTKSRHEDGIEVDAYKPYFILTQERMIQANYLQRTIIFNKNLDIQDLT